MPREHHARVVPYSAAEEDASLALMVECFECPPHPLRWGHLSDSTESLVFLDREAERHNRDFAEGRFDSFSEMDGTIADTIDESEKP